MARLENVVFDMGGVLMDFDGEKFARAFTETDADGELLYRALFGRVEWALLDAGVISHETIARVAAAALPERLRPALEACIEGWPVLSEPFPATNDLAIRLHGRGLGVFLLSNASTRIDEQLGHMPAMAVMDGVVVSARERIMKPDPAIYGLLCERYGLDPATCLFVDDRADNCEGARVAGMRAFHYEGDAAALERAIEGMLAA